MWNLKVINFLFLAVIFIKCTNGQTQRPFYVMGHMVNSITEVQEYLDRGSNGLEADIQFFEDGTVRRAHHGFPCDCFRRCGRSADLREYLEHVRALTEPSAEYSYYDQMLVQMLDLKLSTSGNLTSTGRDVARHVLDYLWTEEGEREQQVRVILYLKDSNYPDVVQGFVDVFNERGSGKRLKDVGFDFGEGDPDDIHELFQTLNMEDNIWKDNGITSCFSGIFPDWGLRHSLRDRDSGDSYIKKVYHWTIDSRVRMRLSLRLGVDAIMTNRPELVNKVLRERRFQMKFRLATLDDSPFERFIPD